MDFTEINSMEKRGELLERIDRQNSRFRTAKTTIIKFGLHASFVELESAKSALNEQQHRNVKTGNKGWGTKTHRKNFAESLSRQQWGGEGKTPPKAARIRHPKIPPLNYAARGEVSLRQGVTNKQKFQPTNSVLSYTGCRAGGYDEKGCGQALPTFSKRMDETFLTPLADQQQKKKLFTK
ncbi:hypothetical protein TNCV_4936531 [Trichonephila clavipes]|nr:hypothetical protein TNCV_4936531 [Trichonephila clavipes]